MSDEREQGPRPDETRPFSPFDDKDDATRIQGQPGSNHPDDGPRSGDAWVFDRSDQAPRDDDATAVAPRPRGDATSIMPPVDDSGTGRAEAPWAGRAEVRPPRPGVDSDYPDSDWAAVSSSEPRGKWWMPIVVGIVALILVALLGWGIWLIIRAQDKNDGTPVPVATTSAAPPPTTQPTTEATTEPPTTRPTTTEPTQTAVTIPALRGLSQQEAQQALSRRGLASRLRFVASTQAPPGTVIDSDPPEGQEVPPDTTVTLIIAAQPTPTTSTTGAPAQPGG
jgi:PASTA domain